MDPHAAESHFTHQDFEKYLCEQIDLKKAAQLRDHVKSCASCEKRLLEAVSLRLAASGNPAKSKRFAARILSSGPGWLQSLSPLSLERLPATLVDTSARGCSMIVPVPLQPGTVVSLGIGVTVSVGTITYCNQIKGGEFRLGIELKSSPKRTDLACAPNLRL